MKKMIFIEDNNEEILNKKYKAIISIDFGSSFSGFSIAYGENKKIFNLQQLLLSKII